MALIFAAPLAAQTKASISAADLRTRLFALAHDSMGGRATGSLGNYQAAEYMAAEFRRFGLEPAGDHGSYFQTIPFFRFRPDVIAGSIVVLSGPTALPVSNGRSCSCPTPPKKRGC